MKISKRQNDLNMRNLEEVIGKCDFKGTASAFSLASRELIESYKEMEIDHDQYSRYMDRAVKMLNDSKCNCIKLKQDENKLVENNLDNVKKEIVNLINYARDSTKKFAEGVINCSDITELTNVLSATEDVRSKTHTLNKLFPGDFGIESLFREANSIYELGYKEKERFVKQCECKNRRKIK
jgi:hypothetical protein